MKRLEILATRRAILLALFSFAAAQLSGCGAAPASATTEGHSEQAQTAHKRNVTYPEEMRGVWMLGNEQCSLPGNYDSDGRIEILADKLVGYEESSKPTDVRRLAESPMAWQINTTVNLGDGWEPDTDKIFVIAAGQLVMTDTDEVRIYTRCKELGHGRR